MTSSAKIVGCAAATLLMTLGCKGADKSAEPTASVQPTTEPAPLATEASKPNPAAEAKKYFKTKCVVCHGDAGHGDGPGSAALDPKPRAFGDAGWQATTTDAAIKKVIVEGGAAVGKSNGMAPNPQLKDQPEVLNELVKLIRSFKP